MPAPTQSEQQTVKAGRPREPARTEPDVKARAGTIKEERSNMVKAQLLVLWTDYVKPAHFEAYPNLHLLFNDATKLAGAAGTKGTNDVEVADKLLAKIEEISEIFWATKK